MTAQQITPEVVASWGLPDEWPLVRFVDAPRADATVRFDCVRDDEQGDPFMWVAKFNPGVAQMVGSPGGPVTYAERVVSFTVVIDGLRREALAAQSELATEVLRLSGWLMWQASPDDQPLFFNVYGSQPSQIDMAEVALDPKFPRDLWQIDLSLTAAAWVAGERITQPMVRVSSDPSDPDGCRTVLDPIVGDAPTPLRVEVLPVRAEAQTVSTPQRWLAGVLSPSSRPGARREPIVLPVTTPLHAEAVVESHPRYVGGQAVAWSKNAASALDLRASTDTVSLPLGTYRMWARMHRFGSATGTIGAEFGGGDFMTPKTLWRTGSGNAEACVWVDLGPRNVGAGGLPADVAAEAPDVDTTVVLTGSIASPGGKLACDAVILVPVPDAGDPTGDDAAWSALALTYPSTNLAEGDVWVWDGAEETSWSVDPDTGQVGSPGAIHEGIAPLGVPGPDGEGDNTLLLLAHTTVDATGFVSAYRDRLDMVSEVVVSYHPRWLWLGDGENRP